MWVGEGRFLTEQRVGAWGGESAPEDLVEEAKKLLEKLAAGEDAARRDWQCLCYELSTRVASKSVKAASASKFLKSLELSPTACESVIDAISILGEQFPGHKASEWTRLKDLVATLVKDDVVAALLFKQLLDPALLAAAGVIPDQVSFDKRLRKLNTDQVYRQQKFNLLREETEGYAKAIVLIGSITAVDVESSISNMLSLIGYFDLDPNRILSLVLDAFEKDLGNVAFFPVIARFKRAFLPHILGFKLQFFNSPDAASVSGEEVEPGSVSSVVTPASLFHLAAALVCHGLVGLREILPYLSPSLEDLAALGKRRHDAMKADAAAVGKVNLNATAGAAPEKVEVPTFGEDNQLLGLLEALIRMRGWDAVTELTSLLKDAGCLNASTHPPIRAALCEVLHSLLEPLYATVSPLNLGITSTSGSSSPAPPSAATTAGSGAGPAAGATGSSSLPGGRPKVPNALKPVTSFKDLLPRLAEPLEMLGTGLHSDVHLFVKICRMLHPLIKAPENSSLWEQEAVQSQLLHVLRTVMLPSMSLIDCNPGVMMELWQVVGCLSFSMRYRLYATWIGGAGKTSPEVLKAEAVASHEMKQLLKRISSDKKKLKHDARMLARLSHSNPLIVFDRIIANAVSYDNQIGPLVESLSFVTPFALDCASFMLVRHLRLEMGSGAGKAGMMSKKFEGAVADWFRNLATFIGAFYRNHPTVELQGLLQFVLEKLNAGSSWELIIIKDLLAKVGGCEYLEQQNDEQVAAYAGGEALRRETTLASDKEPKKVVRRRLQEALQQPETGLPLLVLIAQQRDVVLYHSEQKELKIIGDTFDRCHTVLVQLVEFLSKQRDAYGAIMPSLRRLCQDLRLEPQIALFVARPLIRFASPILPPPEEKGKVKSGSGNSSSSSSAGVTEGPMAAWNVATTDFRDQARSTLPAEAWQHLSMDLYTIFWSHTLQDIHTPQDLYERKINALRRQADKDYRDNMRKEGRQAEQRMTALKAELASQQRQVKHVLETLAGAKATLFQSAGQAPEADAGGEEKEAAAKPAPSTGSTAASLEALLQHCIAPRLYLTEEDALFCARFLLLLHSMDTPNFNTIECIDKVICSLLPTVFCITDREAKNLGIFLQAILEPLTRWYYSKPQYRKEAEAKVGFVKNPEKSSDKMSHAVFRTIFARWQGSILNSIYQCLSSSEKFEQRSGLSVLYKISAYFPCFTGSYQKIHAQLEELAKKDGDGPPTDINSMALGLRGQMEKRAKDMTQDPQEKKSTTAKLKSTGTKPAPKTGGAAASGGGKSSGASSPSPGKKPLPPTKRKDSASDAPKATSSAASSKAAAKGSSSPTTSTEKKSSDGFKSQDPKDGTTSPPLPPPPSGGEASSSSSKRDRKRSAAAMSSSTSPSADAQTKAPKGRADREKKDKDGRGKERAEREERDGDSGDRGKSRGREKEKSKEDKPRDGGAGASSRASDSGKSSSRKRSVSEKGDRGGGSTRDSEPPAKVSRGHEVESSTEKARSPPPSRGRSPSNGGASAGSAKSPLTGSGSQRQGGSASQQSPPPAQSGARKRDRSDDLDGPRSQRVADDGPKRPRSDSRGGQDLPPLRSARGGPPPGDGFGGPPMRGGPRRDDGPRGGPPPQSSRRGHGPPPPRNLGMGRPGGGGGRPPPRR
uniref:THO complex subunit 2 n=1 Tax=Rhizochromulina marina TaxID=1034831 RepID=A0A7S2R5A3_9STRA